MISPEEEAFVLTRAYVPEHIVSLMTLISKGEPFLTEDHLGFVKDNWLIMVGYPLETRFSQENSVRILKQAVETFRPEYLWFIGPEFPLAFADTCRERQTDQYFTYAVEQTTVKPSLRRVADKASKTLTVERGHSMGKEQEELTSELLKREQLPDRVRQLYLAMPDYVSNSPSAWVLNARDEQGRLSAFSVIDLGAKHFSAYILGAHSKKRYAPHASDLLFLEMIALSREQGKSSMNLGLGVNAGIERFKRKWGGVPGLGYEFCECFYPRRKKISLIDALLRKG